MSYHVKSKANTTGIVDPVGDARKAAKEKGEPLDPNWVNPCDLKMFQVWMITNVNPKVRYFRDPAIEMRTLNADFVPFIDGIILKILVLLLKKKKKLLYQWANIANCDLSSKCVTSREFAHLL